MLVLHQLHQMQPGTLLVQKEQVDSMLAQWLAQLRHSQRANIHLSKDLKILVVQVLQL